MKLSPVQLRWRYLFTVQGVGVLNGLLLLVVGLFMLGPSAYYGILNEEFAVHDVAAMCWGTLALVLLGLGVYLLAFGVVGMERHVRLVCRGAPALGRVVAAHAEKRPLSWSVRWVLALLGAYHITYRVTYRPRYVFTDRHGKRHEALLPLRWRAQRCHEGDPVLVLYDPQKPSRCTVDLFGDRDYEFQALLKRAESD